MESRIVIIRNIHKTLFKKVIFALSFSIRNMVPQFVDIHTHFRHGECRRKGISVFSLRLGIDNVIPPYPFTAGIHPWDAENSATSECLAEIMRLSAAGIGEIGLDYACGIDRQTQENVFRIQLELAQQLMLPVTLHCVRAVEDTLRILKDYSLCGVIFHSFVGNIRQAANVLDSGAYISIGSLSLKSSKTATIIKDIPVDRLFIETDDTGEKIEDIYKRVSEVSGRDTESLLTGCYENYIRIYKDK